jgi:hypothetical protein
VVLRLRHSATVKQRVFRVQPSAREGLPRRALRLGDLVGVVRKYQINPTRMNIERLAQVLDSHDRALQMPAGTPRPPWRVPHRDFPFLGPFAPFPENEVAGVLLVVLLVA